MFLVSHDGAVAIPAAALVDAWEREPSNTLSRTPGQVFIDPQVGPAEEIDEPGPSRSRADQSRGMLPWLRSVVITLVILGAVVGVVHIVVVIAESAYTAIRQAVEEGSMTTFEPQPERVPS